MTESSSPGMAFYRCAYRDWCHDVYSKQCPDGRLADPWEWMRCGPGCKGPGYDEPRDWDAVVRQPTLVGVPAHERGRRW